MTPRPNPRHQLNHPFAAYHELDLSRLQWSDSHKVAPAPTHLFRRCRPLHPGDSANRRHRLLPHPRCHAREEHRVRGASYQVAQNSSVSQVRVPGRVPLGRTPRSQACEIPPPQHAVMGGCVITPSSPQHAYALVCADCEKARQRFISSRTRP